MIEPVKIIDCEGKEHIAIPIDRFESAINDFKEDVKHSTELYIYPKSGQKVFELLNKHLKVGGIK